MQSLAERSHVYQRIVSYTYRTVQYALLYCTLESVLYAVYFTYCTVSTVQYTAYSCKDCTPNCVQGKGQPCKSELYNTLHYPIPNNDLLSFNYCNIT